MESLPEWLERKLAERNWRPSDLARAAKLPDATVSRILNGISNTGPEAGLAIAEALEEPPEKVFRLAGLLPPLPGPESDKSIDEIIELIKRLAPDRRKDVLGYALWRFQQQEQDKDNQQADQNSLGPKISTSSI